MARDKLYEARMQGMLQALNTVKESGIEALEKEIRKRNILQAPLAYKEGELDTFWKNFADLYYNNVLTSALWVLYNDYGFRAKRLTDFKKSYNEITACAFDLNYMGEHYVTLADFAHELNEKCDMQLNEAIVASAQETFDKKNQQYKNHEYVTGVINTLRLAGYHDAADFFEAKKETA